ncbi:hypothetical protein AAG570_003636 [Ranatra chinensis]|uniref:Protein kinase domain-containing protein n=1 Tax=Ranatra chinensis TaxID=642074 RepID=A0ABD0Y482_9HEMI
MVCKTRAPDKHLGKFLPREIMSHYLISHDNVIKFRQAIESMYRIYFVTEYAENGSLLDLILEESYIDETRSRVWFRQLVDAVDYCHRIGVVHRDIRCDNLLFDGNYTLKLSNFGFARAQMLPGKVDGCYPLSDTYCGSYAYSAPEVIKGVPYYPQAADVWSMGVVLFAMVFGKLPFDDTNYPKLIKVSCQGNYVFTKSIG